MKKILFGFIFFLGALGSLSCQKKDVSLQVNNNNQTLRINFSYSPFSIDPRKCTDPITTVMNFMLYEGLTRLESDGSVSMALAEKVTISSDQTIYTFYLKKAKWSDGSRITAYDFEESWKETLSPHFPSKSAYLLFSIINAKKAKKGKCSINDVGVKALDHRRLEVQLKKPIPYFLELTSFCTFFPVPNHGKEVPYPNKNQNLVFNGPFILKNWVHDDKITVEKNPYYWNVCEVKLNKIYATIIKDESTALKMYEQGNLDWIGGMISPLPLDAIASLKNKSKLNQKSIAGTTIASFNVHKPPFNNKNIRKAFSYAINRQNIIDNLSQMFDDIANGPIPNVLKNQGDVFSFPDNSEELSKEYLNAGLHELGISKKDLPLITYNYFSSELQRNIAIYIQSIWKKTLGIEVTLKCHELKNHLVKLNQRDFQIAQMSWIGQYHDKMNFLERFKKKDTFRNYSGWESSSYQKLLKESFYQEGKKREIMLDQAEKMIMDDMPIIPIYHYHLVYLENPIVKNILISPMGDIQFHKVYLK